MYLSDYLKNKKLIVLLMVYSLFVLVATIGFTGQKASATVYEDGSNYPADVINLLNIFCWNGGAGQRSAQTTWISIDGNPGIRTTTISKGQP